MWGLQNYEATVVTVLATLIVGSGLIFVVGWTKEALHEDGHSFRSSHRPITSPYYPWR
jgi:hypothetical protein